MASCLHPDDLHPHPLAPIGDYKQLSFLWELFVSRPSTMPLGLVATRRILRASREEGAGLGQGKNNSSSESTVAMQPWGFCWVPLAAPDAPDDATESPAVQVASDLAEAKSELEKLRLKCDGATSRKKVLESEVGSPGVPGGVQQPLFCCLRPKSNGPRIPLGVL